jgi:uncharacterized protein
LNIQELQDFVLVACQAETNRFGAAFWDQHILVVRDAARELARELGGDLEVIDLAAYLHDLAALQNFADVARHHLLAAEIAADMLARAGYPHERIQLVQECIRAHSAPLPAGGAPPEVVCISQADAAAQIARPAYWLWYAFQVRGMAFEQGVQWYLQRIERHWAALGEPARQLVRERYTLARECLSQ